MGYTCTFCDKLANPVERAYIGPSLMGHGDVETGLEKLNETLKDLDYSNKLMQALMDGQKVK